MRKSETGAFLFQIAPRLGEFRDAQERGSRISDSFETQEYTVPGLLTWDCFSQ